MDLHQPKTSAWLFTIFVLFCSVTNSQVVNSHEAAHSYMAEVSAKLQRKFPTVVNPQHTTAGADAPHPRPVVVRCHPDSLEVVVQADMFNTGLNVDGRHLRLGMEEQVKDPQSACRAFPSGPTEFTIRVYLTDCGTRKLPPTGDEIIYSNVLVYSPEPSSDGLLRLDGAAIPVECHYKKFYSVKGTSLFPTWVPFMQKATAENQIYFSLKLMTGDWQFERAAYTYYVGDPIYFEISSTVGKHKPLQVYVDHCVATATPDAEAVLRYDFIDHHGCLADAYLTNSSSRFLSRAEDHRIQFQLDAFKFYQEETNQIYITCHLTAVPSLVNVNSQHRACSLMENRWRSADGNDEVCRSCSVAYPVQEPPPTAPTSAKSLTSPRGLVQNAPEQQPANYLRIRPRTHKTYLSSAGSKMKGENKKGMVEIGPLLILPSSRTSNVTGQRGLSGLGIVR